ncbi:YcaO-like family protein [Pseudovibrio brasiliensis]|uniref:YcaO-like family protein n=1 Tax=Pseudovibrio brasiliensis TaxID=1898042 RepID=A0ABX8AN18_9HYPH|nr:YcaO-like family protein [Pseudovibrio brasiliensis]QUS55059.1 YcaO-like family protein [Pseudovibrio brasiliensis]
MSTVKKRYRKGTHRLVSPEETILRVEPFLQSFGITRVANVTGLDKIGLPVVAVYRPNARSLAVSQGKGLDLPSAKASGIMEAIEGYHAEHAKLALRMASFREISQEGPVLDVARLPGIENRLLDRDRQILWCEGHDLMAEGPVWVPYEMVHTNFTLPLSGSSGHFQMSSNGLASGNCWQEAVSHGICELVERDALALWSAHGAMESPQGRLDLSGVEDPECLRVLQMLHDAGQAVGVWSVTADIGLPAFACTIVDHQLNHLGQMYASDGSGCHCVREVALLRALTEAAQTRLTSIAGARDDAHRDFFEASRKPERVEKIRKIVSDGAERASLSFADVPSFDGESFEADISYQLSQLRAVGVEQVATVNLGGIVEGIEVARVVIPGLEGLHDAPGYVPGKRLKQQELSLAGGS